MKVWDIFDKKGLIDTLQHSGSEVVSMDFHPNGKELLVSTLSGQVYMWQAEDGSLMSTIPVKSDLAGGRLQTDRMTAQNNTMNKHFTSLACAPNGDYFIGAGNSKHVCVYDLKHRLLIRRYAIT